MKKNKEKYLHEEGRNINQLHKKKYISSKVIFNLGIATDI